MVGLRRGRPLRPVLVAGTVAVAAGAFLLVDAVRGGSATPASGTAGDPAAPSAPVVGAPDQPVPVAPAPGHPLDGVDRDAGIAVALRDGSTLWLFGDTAERRADESLEYFVIGTASWAPPGRPTETRDVTDGGRPVAFAPPGDDFPACPDGLTASGMWPTAAVVQPVDRRDRVLVWMENVCLGEGGRGQGVGMSLTEWWYDPSAPPDGRPVTGTVLNQNLFPARGFGQAALTLDGRTALVYACAGPNGRGGWPNEYGPCQVARVDLDRAEVPDAYQVWDGTGWATIASSGAARLELPRGSAVGPVPVGGFSVSLDAATEKFVMVYSPWPGPTDRLHVRVADRPQGPWSEPSSVPLPGCVDQYFGSEQLCYAAMAQPILSGAGRLGIGYYDRFVSGGPMRGAYLVTSVPFDVPS